MQSVVFLSDVHLSEEDSDKTDVFLSTLRRLEKKSLNAVFILGDLFDYWIGDDCCNHYHLNIAKALHKLSRHCPVYFQHGNRDFLIGPAYAAESGMQLLPENKLIRLDKENILVQHGDQLCSHDQAYQRLRRLRNSALTRKYFLALSPFFREKAAGFLRKKSRAANEKKSAYIMDVHPETVKEYCQLFGTKIIIHGHTHRPAIHRCKQYTRYVLGDWRPEAYILYYHKQQFAFLNNTQI